MKLRQKFRILTQRLYNEADMLISLVSCGSHQVVDRERWRGVEKRSPADPSGPFYPRRWISHPPHAIPAQRAWIEMNDCQIEAAICCQSPSQRDQLPLGSAVTEVTDKEGKSAWLGAFGHSL